MMVIDDRVAQRREVYSTYVKYLAQLPGITFLPEPDGYKSNRWLTAILVDERKAIGITGETIRLALKKDNIEARPLWKPMHLQPVFKNYPAYTNGISEDLFNVLCD
jgi:dTDP-4-amino-4,6-dideoxygalactose transaminase